MVSAVLLVSSCHSVRCCFRGRKTESCSVAILSNGNHISRSSSLQQCKTSCEEKVSSRNSVRLFTLKLFCHDVTTLQRFYIPSNRQLKRLHSVAQSPVYSHFQESLTGSNLIIATRSTDRFTHQNELLMDSSNKSYFPTLISQRLVST